MPIWSGVSSLVSQQPFFSGFFLAYRVSRPATQFISHNSASFFEWLFPALTSPPKSGQLNPFKPSAALYASLRILRDGFQGVVLGVALGTSLELSGEEVRWVREPRQKYWNG
jgi:hypothetical protein